MNGWRTEEPFDWWLLGFSMLFGIVILLDPRLGVPIEKLECERSSFGDHLHEPTFERLPERLLLAVLVR